MRASRQIPAHQHVHATFDTDLRLFRIPRARRDYTIRMTLPEFTCLCPKTGQPDFATFELEYVPDELCVELKSLKLYMWSFRDQGAFHEAVTNQIADDLAAACEPRFLRLTGKFNVRGGIYTTVVVERRKSGLGAAARSNCPDFSSETALDVAVFNGCTAQKSPV